MFSFVWCKLPILAFLLQEPEEQWVFYHKNLTCDTDRYLRCAACLGWIQEFAAGFFLLKPNSSGCVLKAQGTSLAYPRSFLLSEVQANPTMCCWKSSCSDSDLLFLFWGNAMLYSSPEFPNNLHLVEEAQVL